MKKILNLCLIFILFFVFTLSVNAEVGNYSYSSTSYCFSKDGTYEKTSNAKVYSEGNISDGCNSYYGGTIAKTINGSNAYCVQANSPMNIGKTCTAVSYNEFGWMNGNWDESNAVKTGYIMEYINSQNYSNAVKYVYIVNAANQMLQFKNAFPVRTLNSEISYAISYANDKSTTYKKVSTNNPISAKFKSSVLENVDNKYAKGEIDLSIVNGSYDALMNVSFECDGCSLYTDSGFSEVYTGSTLSANERKNMTLYVRTGDYVEDKDISVTFVAKYDKINYPIGKVWNCGDGKQALITLSSESYQIPSASVTTISKVPAIKRTCEIYNGVYYGINGEKVTKEKYTEQCEKPVVVEVPSTGSKSNSFLAIFGSLFITSGVGSVMFIKKKIKG